MAALHLGYLRRSCLGSEVEFRLCLGFLDARQARRWDRPGRRASEKAQSLTRGVAARVYGDLSCAALPPGRLPAVSARG